MDLKRAVDELRAELSMQPQVVPDKRILLQSLLVAAIMAAAAHRCAAGEIEVRRNVAYSKAAAGGLLADVYLPVGEGPFPAVLVVHGGAWTIGNKSQLAFAARQL